MKLKITKTANAWHHAYRITIGGDVIAWINIYQDQDQEKFYCSSPLEALNDILDPITTSGKHPNFGSALGFCITTLLKWTTNLRSQLKQINFIPLDETKIEKEPYIPSAGAMYGA